MFIEDFREYLESAVISGNNFIITGDFNYHVNDPDDQDAQLFLELLQESGLVQYVKRPTDILGNTLDLVIVRASDNLCLSDPVDDLYVSDHSFVTTTMPMEKPSLLTQRF